MPNLIVILTDGTKFCIDCKHYYENGYNDHCCAAGVDPIANDIDVSCDIMRSDEELCGTDGKLYASK